MVEKQVEIDKAWVVRKKIRDEVEFPRTRVMTAGSRAEAATCLAEVEIEANATSKASLTDEGKKKFSRVEELLEQSRAALDQERYDGACALAYQALALIDEIQFQSAPVRKAKASAYADFLEPLQLRTVKKAMSVHVRAYTVRSWKPLPPNRRSPPMGSGATGSR